MSHAKLFFIGICCAGMIQAQSAPASRFPMVGFARGQALVFHVIALGTNQGRCLATLGFKDASGAATGPTLQVDLRIGQAKTLLFPGTGIADGQRLEVRPVIEQDNDSSCFAAIELAESFAAGAIAYLAAASAPPSRPIDHALPSFVLAASGDTVRFMVHRIDNSSPCRVRVTFQDDRGKTLATEQELAPDADQAQFADYKASGPPKSRVILVVRPSMAGSTAGCMAATEVFDQASGKTKAHVPFAVARSNDPILPTAPTRTRSALVRTPSSSSMPIGVPIVIQAPLGLPPISFPADNPPTAETIALGRRIFYDKSLSRDRTTACASCHDPAAGFRDPRRVSIGVNGMEGERQSMTIFNVAFAKDVFWDGRAKNLEEQAHGPVENALEFAFSLGGVEKRFQADATYVEQFKQAFGPGPITYDKIAKCLASFQRTVVSGNSPFDRFFFGGDRTALSVSAQSGMFLFTGVANCSKCHKIEGKYATFSDDGFHNSGVAAIGIDSFKDLGRFKVTGVPTDRGAFRPPSLRNVALHAPYMHDGSLATLPDVVLFYARGGRANRWLDRDMPAPIPANIPVDPTDLVNFLQSLTGEMPENVGPPQD